VRDVAEATVKHQLNRLTAWGFINIDDCWNGGTRDAVTHRQSGKHAFTVDAVRFGRFEGMRCQTDTLHSLGLHMGICTGPKVSTYAGFLGASTKGNAVNTELFSPANGNSLPKGPTFVDFTGTGSDGAPGAYQSSQVFGRWWNGYDASATVKQGDTWWGTVDVGQFGEWGFDYLKLDWALWAGALGQPRRWPRHRAESVEQRGS
jgi:hypothetical protein